MIIQHLLDGLLFGIGFGLVNLPFELYLMHLKKKRSRTRTRPHLKLVKNNH